jgi:hypothetical protein
VTSVITGMRRPSEVAGNFTLVRTPVRPVLWDELKRLGLIDTSAPTSGWGPS